MLKVRDLHRSDADYKMSAVHEMHYVNVKSLRFQKPFLSAVDECTCFVFRFSIIDGHYLFFDVP